MRICVLGAGALGSALGGVLADGGADVRLLGRVAHMEAIAQDGLMLREGQRDRKVRLQAHTDAAAIGAVDLVIVLVKSFHTREAVMAARALVGPETTVLSLQNGLGHEDVLTEVVGRDRVIAGKTYVGGVMLAPGHVRVGTLGKETLIGELDGTVSARVRRIAAVFEAAGLAISVSTNILGVIWDKLLVNVATGALSGITRLPYGPLYAVPEVEECAIAAVAEAMAVAQAQGVTLATRDAREAWVKAAEGLPPEFKASMLQSLEKGSATEIDFINGAVVRWGERSGVPTPVNRALVACIKGIEASLGRDAAVLERAA
ncbi:ketopantoate reductase family protein [Muricoccus aerilatus]|uniref:ketopantoate reductase family protein n=1 Tax=Muricoccus aerilatus TaxID=452982 RepID=UPI0005C24698|nr:ketopantoate reductase family protein [Roseomonas aerilata]